MSECPVGSQTCLGNVKHETTEKYRTCKSASKTSTIAQDPHREILQTYKAYRSLAQSRLLCVPQGHNPLTTWRNERWPAIPGPLALRVARHLSYVPKTTQPWNFLGGRERDEKTSAFLFSNIRIQERGLCAQSHRTHPGKEAVGISPSRGALWPPHQRYSSGFACRASRADSGTDVNAYY